MASSRNSILAPKTATAPRGAPSPKRATKPSKTPPPATADSACPRQSNMKGYLTVPAHVPHDVPGSYIMQTAGNCQAPLIIEGDRLFAEPVLPEVGEYACFYFFGREQGLIKRLTNRLFGWPVSPQSECVPIIEFHQINPYRNYGTPGDKIEAMHRVRWLLRGDTWIDLAFALSQWDKVNAKPSTGFYLREHWDKVPTIPLMGSINGPNSVKVVDLLREEDKPAYLAGLAKRQAVALG
jgi:hypothetical protein